MSIENVHHYNNTGEQKIPVANAPTRVLKPKTYHFVNRVWAAFYHLLVQGNDLAIANEEDVVEEINIDENDGEDSFVDDAD